MKYVSGLLLFFAPQILLATVGEPTYVTDVYLDSTKKEIWYETDWGYGQFLSTISVATGRQIKEIEAGADASEKEWEAYEERKRVLRSRFLPLKEVDLAGLGLIFKTEPRVETAVPNKYFLGEHPAEGMEWKITAYSGDTLAGTGKIYACTVADRINFRGYSLPGKHFLLIVASTLSACFEGGYTGETVFLVNAPVTAKNISPISTAIPEADGRKVRGSVSSPLEHPPLPNF